ncbi:MAG: hypothetical protein KDA96_05050 [Planctomycetaceae bacterium]|nr:hypothetical protein [Planctomycetaceae bacterium]
MTESLPFDEIAVLIPGYSIEDLPTDLNETSANSLLNALAVAWHPKLLNLSRGIPCTRQAETAGELPGHRLLLVPSCAEDWMPHEWQSALRDRGNIVLSRCSTRREWLDALDSAIDQWIADFGSAAADEVSQAEYVSQTEHDESSEALSPPESSAVSLPLPQTSDDGSAPPASQGRMGNEEASASPHTTRLHSAVCLADDFLAFGTVYFQIILLSRRMHHFVEPDEYLLSNTIHIAAAAACRGDVAEAELRLHEAFGQLRETRERFFPMDCVLVDICVPSGDAAPLQLIPPLRDQSPQGRHQTSECDAVESDQVEEFSAQPASSAPAFATHPVNIAASASELCRWAQEFPEFRAWATEAIQSDHLCLLTGHSAETRVSLNSAASLLSDLRTGREKLVRAFQAAPVCWARKRFGLTANLPLFLSHQGFDAAMHVALDDGLYPDREQSSIEWATAGSSIAATSRIPIAIDSGTSMLKLADRMAESMRDDSVAVLFVARLPQLQSPWLPDLQKAASYAPVLGQFVTFAELMARTDGTRHRTEFSHGEYLSPALIQSSVLKSETPVTGPAELFRLRNRLEGVRFLTTLAGLLRVPDTRAVLDELQAIEERLLNLDNLQAEGKCEPDSVSNESESRITPPQDSSSVLKCQDESRRNTSASVRSLQRALAAMIAERIGKAASAQDSVSQSLVICNTLPFARTACVLWPDGWRLPTENPALEMVSDYRSLSTLPAGTIAPVPDAVSADLHRLAYIKLPPGGFVWLAPSENDRTAASLFTAPRREPPLAEGLSLRNRLFEVTLSERTGGIASVNFYNQRANRVAQQVALRFEQQRDIRTGTDDEDSDPGRTWYSTVEFVDSRVVTSTATEGAIETTVRLLDPSNGKPLATVRQLTTVCRLSSRIEILVSFDNVRHKLTGNPWMTYFGARFAWDNEAAAVTRSVLGQSADFRGERFESPDYIEVADQDHRLLIVPHGRPYHRRSGPRMLDSLLIVEGETASSFRLTLDFDQPWPQQTVQDLLTPPAAVPVEKLLSPTVTNAWLLGLSAKNVTLVTSEVRQTRPIDGTDADSNPQPVTELHLTLLETEMKSCTCIVRTARTPATAQLLRSINGIPVSLAVNETGVSVSLSGGQMVTVVLGFSG